MIRREIRERIRKLEQDKRKDLLEPSRIEILSNDEVEIYTVKNGREVVMKESEYQEWIQTRRKLEREEVIEIEVDEWEE